MKRDITKILGIKIDSLTKEEALSSVEEIIGRSRAAFIATPNTEMIIKAQGDDHFREMLNDKSALNLPDSYGLLWAGRFQTLWAPKTPGLRQIIVLLEWIFSILILPLATRAYHYPIKSKLSGSDFIWDLSRLAAVKRYKLFLFGGGPTVAEQAALRLQTEILGLRIGGMMSGDLSKSDEVVEAVKKSRSEILLVCLGAPLQEEWLVENLKATGAKIGIGLGGTFDFVARVVPRAPSWMQHAGLEWLFRLIIEPKRLFRQMALPKFMFLMLLDRLKSG
ncbi:MAG: WecB/TagA/CpsF family glycosyltransferase [Patescibacteria group bacterium]|jgi:N-acetylglucosaminyldiphosphoundecaprenol N-acetyl-beta-D-mannosaminyltransferase